MVEKKVKICDECKKKVSKKSCSFCKRDLCEDCLDEDLDEDGYFKFTTCDICAEKLQDALSLKVNKKKINKLIFDLFQNMITTEKI